MRPLPHTDIHAAHGDWPIKPPLPLIPGHEGVGIVEELGPGTGKEISVATASPSHGSVSHADTVDIATPAGRRSAEAQINTGYGMAGGYAEYAAASSATSSTCLTAWPLSTRRR